MSGAYELEGNFYREYQEHMDRQFRAEWNARREEDGMDTSDEAFEEYLDELVHEAEARADGDW